MTMLEDLCVRMTDWRRHLHAWPEVSGQEAETAAFISARLTELGIEHWTGIGGHGVVARLSRPGSNRSVALRADIDALPIQEGAADGGGRPPHASRRDGVMHACGHDGHAAALLGAGALLQADPDWRGVVHLIFQPAEENGLGAKAMLADGLFDRFPSERLFAFHNWPGVPLATVAVHDRPAMAAGGDWRVTLRGVAGHAARPHLTRDTVTAAAHLIVALNTIVPRNVDPLATVVLTASMIHGGVVSNQIPGVTTITGTLRTFDAALRAQIIARMREVIEGTARAMGVEADYEINSTGRVVENSAEGADLAIAAAGAAGLPVTRAIDPVMGGDDMAFLMEGRPSAYVFIGTGPAGPAGNLHEQGYDFNDAILGPAATWLAAVARLALQR